ncbi:MAG: 50S ribosomal protein L21e [Methermicoccaceae archaeon]
MDKSHGTRRKSRYKLQKSRRERGLSPITRTVQRFEIGEKVNVKIDSSIHKGAPHHKFHGKTAEVVGKRGRAYILKARDGRAIKEVIVLPEHLRPHA